MSPQGQGSRLASAPPRWQWTVLIALSAAISLVWGAAGLPAALLLGPLLAGLTLGVQGVRLTVPRPAYIGAQGLLAAMVAGTITPATVASLGHHSALFGVVMVGTMAGCTAIGWLLSRTRLIPGATAIYGTSPGAASAMILLAEAEGADPRLVAFMQYTRVLLVALSAALVAHLWIQVSGARPPSAGLFAPVPPGPVLMVLCLALAGQQLARWVGLQAWALLGPMLLLSTLHALGWVSIDLPRWLLALAYCLLGWHIGLGFRRESLMHAGKVLPWVLLSGLSLVGFCALLAWGLARLAHIDPLTAYLATSPGGLDSVAIIAASTHQVDLPFVLALQSVRLLFAIALMPPLTRWVVRGSAHLQPQSV